MRGIDGVYDHARNVPDDLLVELAESGGVIHVNAFGGYLEELEARPERDAALEALDADFPADLSEMSDEELQAYRDARIALDREFPPARSSFEKYVEHLLYTIELVGIDHVGIGADWDGGGGVDGMADVVAVPKITQALLDAGYGEADIEKVWSGNLLRLMRAAEEARTASLDSPEILQ